LSAKIRIKVGVWNQCIFIDLGPISNMLKIKKIMATNRTFTMIKPEAVANGHIGAILERINAAGFRIVSMKKTELTSELAGAFYAVHKERPFYGELVSYMSSGPIVAAILEKDNAVSDFRALIGATDPSEAADGTIRKEFAESKAKNAVHGSDSDENAEIEGTFFFSQFERF
tara:strand:+ start:2812 stop:3327 length:516 start_codon:yes stop_codon:yes gene_type:complete